MKVVEAAQLLHASPGIGIRYRQMDLILGRRMAACPLPACLSLDLAPVTGELTLQAQYCLWFRKNGRVQILNRLPIIPPTANA